MGGGIKDMLSPPCQNMGGIYHPHPPQDLRPWLVLCSKVSPPEYKPEPEHTPPSKRVATRRKSLRGNTSRPQKNCPPPFGKFCMRLYYGLTAIDSTFMMILSILGFVLPFGTTRVNCK